MPANFKLDMLTLRSVEDEEMGDGGFELAANR